MNYVFVDCDGVLNDNNYMKEIGYAEREYLWVDPKAVKRLADLTKKYNAKIIMTSTWRKSFIKKDGCLVVKPDRVYYNDEESKYTILNKLMAHNNVYFSDKTINLFNSGNHWDRIDEITSYIQNHLDLVNDKDKYVIIDDEADMLLKTEYDKQYYLMLGHLVKTDANGSGFDDKAYNEACKILNTDKSDVWNR